MEILKCMSSIECGLVVISRRGRYLLGMLLLDFTLKIPHEADLVASAVINLCR